MIVFFDFCDLFSKFFKASLAFSLFLKQTKANNLPLLLYLAKIDDISPYYPQISILNYFTF